MRVIKFRGKVDGVWWYAEYNPDEAFGNWEQFWHVVDRETVGQYIGIQDKSGKDIYEGDIARWKVFVGGRIALDEEVRYIADVVELSHGVYATRERYQYLGTIEPFRELEIIGNVYDNPELLEEEQP